MGKHYLHLHDCNGRLADPQGVDLPSAASAIDAALEGARCMMSQGVKDGAIDVSWRIEITDGQGRIVHSLLFKDAVRISGV